MTVSQVIAAIALVAIGAAVLVGFFYGGYRIIRNGDWGWLGWFVGLWLVGFGWLVGLVYVLGHERRRRLAHRHGEPYAENGTSPDRAYEQEVTALSHRSAISAGTIVRELQERGITTREWAAEHDIDTSKWRTPK